MRVLVQEIDPKDPANALDVMEISSYDSRALKSIFVCKIATEYTIASGTCDPSVLEKIKQ
jgi:hypothetical protein